MVLKRLILTVFFCVAMLHCNAQNPVKGVIEFDQNTYGGARQNWSVSIAKDGMVHFANHTGLLSFDGTNWTLNNLPNRTIVRSVNAKSDSVIYTGGYMEFGYWKPNETGDMKYYSLSSKANEFLEATPNIEFWNISVQDQYVYFQSFNKILVYHNDSIYPLNLDGGISVMNKVNGKVLVAVRDNGIWEIEKDQTRLVTMDEQLANTTFKFLIPFGNEHFLIGTAEKGIFLWNGTNLIKWNEPWTLYFIENEVNRGCHSNDGKIIIGTLVDGIVVFDKEGNLLMKVNNANGLPNNTVLGIGSDEWNNIWLALDIGIGFIPASQNRSYVIQELPGTGAVYANAIFKNKLYLGTNKGLFVKSLDFMDNMVSLVPETQDQIWNLTVIDNELLVGHNQGSFIIKDDKAEQISNEAGAFNFIQDPFNQNLIIQSTYNNLVVYEKTEAGVRWRNRISGFANLIRYIEFDHIGNIWGSHMHRGIYRIQVDDSRKNITNWKYYGEGVFSQNHHSIHVFKIENRIVFTTGEIFFTYDDLQDSIIEYDDLNFKLGNYSSSHRIVAAPNHHYWLIGNDQIGLFSIIQDSVKLVKEYPTSMFDDPLLVDGFENLLPVNEYTAILSLQNGIALLDAAVSNSNDQQLTKYKPIVRRIELSNNKEKRVILPLDIRNIDIKNNLNTVTFKFSFPLINENPISYQYKLDGLENRWSQLFQNSEFRFERLPAGNYTLMVKSVDIWGNESEPYKISFKILPPLFASRWAIILYNIALISILLAFRRWGIKQTQKKEQQQHEKREKELIRLRNEKLGNEVRFKSKELANSTMAIMRKNEFLIELKKIIRKQKNELGSRYPDKYFNYLNNKIDQNISSRDDRQIFESNFERAYEQFFQKMKVEFPELTSSDLQLCAYLRMNLSSKEIAPLLGISVRGVENHRYRVRKKMRLEHNQSLSDIILKV